MQDAKCKICRRSGEKLFLKGDKCSSPKCALLRKPSPPGASPQKRRRIEVSEYGKEMKEAQKIKKMYGIQDRQLKKIVKDIIEKKGQKDASETLIKELEMMLSNIIFRSQLARSRAEARQLVSHGHFLLNGKKIDIPSAKTKVGDEIKLKEKSKKSSYFKNILTMVKTENIPNWLSFDKNNFLIKVVREPSIDEIGDKTNVPLILSFYSR